MTDLLEQMKTRAEQAQTAYEAYKAECEKVEELPEVFYLDAAWPMGWHFKEGCAIASYWNGSGTDFASYKKRSGLDIDQHTEKVTAAEYNNARALYHGADFTGRLHEIDRPVCELNQATRDEMEEHNFDEYDVLSGNFAEWGNVVGAGAFEAEFGVERAWGNNAIYRLRAPKKRPMTVKQCLQFQSHNGDAIRYKGGKANPPQLMSAEVLAAGSCERAPIATLNDDGTGGEWEEFEVEV